MDVFDNVFILFVVGYFLGICPLISIFMMNNQNLLSVFYLFHGKKQEFRLNFVLTDEYHGI